MSEALSRLAPEGEDSRDVPCQCSQSRSFGSGFMARMGQIIILGNVLSYIFSVHLRNWAVLFSAGWVTQNRVKGNWLMECFTTVLGWCVILLRRQVPGTKFHPRSHPALICCQGKEFIAAPAQACLCNYKASIIWLTAVVKCLVYFKSTVGAF